MQQQSIFVVTPEFKTKVTDILNTKKFTVVFPFMNLINREGFNYTETELNQLVQFIGELPYSEVSDFFTLIPSLVQKSDENAKMQTQPTETVLETEETEA